MDFLTVDTETTGLDPWHGCKPFLVTIAHDKGVDYWEWDVNPEDRQPIIPKGDIKEIKRYLKGKTLVFQNAKFDVRMLGKIGIHCDWKMIHDTSLLSHLLNSSNPKKLEFAALYYLQLDISKTEKDMREVIVKARTIGKNLEWMIGQDGLECMPSSKKEIWKTDMWLPRAIIKHHPSKVLKSQHDRWQEVTATYANADSEVTRLLFIEQMRLLELRKLTRIYEQRLRVLPIAYNIEQGGVTVNSGRLHKLIEDYKEESAKASRVCRNIARRFNHNLELPKSGVNNSLRELIFDKMGLEVCARSKKTGEPSMNKEAMEKYKTILKPKTKEHKFITSLFAKRKRDTALSYMDSYKRFWIPTADKGWYKLYPAINPVGTSTLRWSSQNPNEQNISKKEGFNLRYAFGPAPGREWWALDYNNLELRIPAYECREPAMLELFEAPNDPPYYGSYHLLIFSLLYPDLFKKHGQRVKDIYKSTLYQYTKNGNFAELYGAVDTGDGKSTADKAFHFPGAQQIVASKLSKKSALNQYWINHAKEHGYVTTLPDKSVDPDRGYPLFCSRNKWGKISPTIPLNYHVQGTACWIMMQAMIKVDAYLPPGYFMVMQIHDELVFDFPYKKNKGNLPKIRKIQKLMESCGDDVGVPLTCGIDYHPNDWSTAA